MPSVAKLQIFFHKSMIFSREEEWVWKPHTLEAAGSSCTTQKTLKWHKASVKQPEPLNFHLQATTFEGIHHFWSLINESEWQCVQPAPKTALTFSTLLGCDYFKQLLQRVWSPAGHYVVLLVARALLSITGQVRMVSGCPDMLGLLWMLRCPWGFAPTPHCREMRASLLHPHSDCPQLRISNWLKADPFLALFILGEWFQEDAAAPTNHDPALAQLSPAPCRKWDLNGISVSFLEEPSPVPLPFQSMNNVQNSGCTLLLRAGGLSIVSAVKKTDFSHSFLCKASSCPQASTKAGPQKQWNDMIKTCNSS